MKHSLFVLLLTCQAGTLALAKRGHYQQVPNAPSQAVTAPQSATVAPAKVTAPVAKTLTAAEQRQKERIDRERQLIQQQKAEDAQRQREYEAKQAEKERQKLARQAEKERVQRERDAERAGKTKPAETPVVATPAAVVPAQAPTPAQPVETPKRAGRRMPKDPVVEAPAAADPAHPESASEEVKPENPRPAVNETKAPLPNQPSVVVPPAVRPRREKPVTTAVADPAAGLAPTAKPLVSRPGREFLPNGHLFAPILLDPLESQAYGSVLPGFWTDGQKYRGSIVPFAFGFIKPFYRQTTAPGRSSEWALDVASFTQFEVYFDEVKREQRRQIINTDYKVSITYNLRRNDHTWRFRLYHLSSHLGDDYLFRNHITAPTTNSVNYEIVDATYSRNVRDWRVYGGLGIGLRKSEERKRLSAQIGAFYKKPSAHFARLVGGIDVKFWQQTDFRPGIHGGIGVEVGRTQHNLTFLVEGYSGFRPYSQYENQQVQWLGIGMYLTPF